MYGDGKNRRSAIINFNSTAHTQNKGARHTLVPLYALLIAFNLIIWGTAFYAFHDNAVLLGAAVLAYTFGLQHAVDADHIAAIDNVTRKLMQEGKRPLTAGLFFSLGHSSVVIIATLCIVFATSTVFTNQMQQWQEMGSIVSVAISAVFLLFIAFINILIFISILRLMITANRNQEFSHQTIDTIINKRGFFAKRLRLLFQMVSKNWHMYPLGILFGIGFDTASEITILSIAATETIHGMSLWTVLIFPALFTAGMTLIDTTDGVLMVGVYGWAFLKPTRKLLYNLTITFISIVIALFIGTLEVLDLISKRIDQQTVFAPLIQYFNDNYSNLGYIIIGIFIISWLFSYIIYKFIQFEDN